MIDFSLLLFSEARLSAKHGANAFVPAGSFGCDRAALPGLRVRNEPAAVLSLHMARVISPNSHIRPRYTSHRC